MYISNRLAGTATGDSLANLAARAASRATEAPAEAESNANLSGGSYDPSAHVSLSVDALLILHVMREATPLDMNRGECSWILEDNLPMRLAIENVGGDAYKTYRVYEKALTDEAAIVA